MNRSILTPKTIFTLALLSALLLLPAGIFASEAGNQTKEPSMMGMCEKMMEHHRAMEARMKTQETELAGALAKLDSAKGQARVDALVAVVHELAQEQGQMHAQMSQMEPNMMQHMASHMKEGMGAKAGSMTECPMMKMHDSEPSGGTEKADGAGDHAEHHPGF